MAKNKPSASNPRGLSDQEITDEAHAFTVAHHIEAHGIDAKLSGWVQSRPDVRQSILAYVPWRPWSPSMQQALALAQDHCRSMNSREAAAACLLG
jgi:hypothetical protein